MKKREYNSRRRTEGAARTRQAIVDAAVVMHGRGITSIPAVAEEAGVSVPTVTKHFPTRDELFAACTSHFASTLELPSLDELSDIADAHQRLRAAVGAIFNVHETSLGHMWTGYRLEDESPAMKAAVEAYEGFVDELANVVLQNRRRSRAVEAQRSVLRAMLGPLAYRALRLKGGLTHEQAVDQTVRMLAAVLELPAS